jgi:hypothetical protein
LPGAFGGRRPLLDDAIHVADDIASSSSSFLTRFTKIHRAPLFLR